MRICRKQNRRIRADRHKARLSERQLPRNAANHIDAERHDRVDRRQREYIKSLILSVGLYINFIFLFCGEFSEAKVLFFFLILRQKYYMKIDEIVTRATQRGQRNDINRRYGRCNQRYVVRINRKNRFRKQKEHSQE